MTTQHWSSSLQASQWLTLVTKKCSICYSESQKVKKAKTKAVLKSIVHLNLNPMWYVKSSYAGFIESDGALPFFLHIKHDRAGRLSVILTQAFYFSLSSSF